MERFDTMLEAAEFAAICCKHWKFATSDDRYDVKELLMLAETSDSENPADEDSFYVVTSCGAIGYCEDGEEIGWLFLSLTEPNAELPVTYETDSTINFCPKCGAGVLYGAEFCGHCGTALRKL